VSLTAKNVNQKVVYTANRVEQVKQFNDVLFHFAYAMHVYAHRHDAEPQQPPSKIAHSEPSNLSSSFAALAGSLNPIQATVLKVYAEDQSSEGVHVSMIIRRLAEKYSEQSVKQTVQWLLNEGYLYNTIDNDHAKSVME
jgi:replication factor A2